VQQEVRALRAADVAVDPGEVTLPLMRVPRTVEEAGASAPDWWATMTWDHAKHLKCGTLIDVPRAVKAAFADLKLDLISEVEDSRGDVVPNEIAWMKLSFIDALVLNSSRSPGESQVQSVARRILQVRDGEWESLWREATEGRDRAAASASRTPQEAEAALAARIEDLAHAGQARRAARAVSMTKPAVTDKARVEELRALFPPAPLIDAELLPDAAGDAPRATKYWEGAEGAAKRALMVSYVVRSVRRPARRTAPGPMGSRPEHWEVLTATSDGVERFANLVVDLALGQVPRGVVRGHSHGEVIAIEKDNGGIRPLVMHSILRRVGLAAVTRVTKAQAKVAAGTHQLGIGTPDGCAKAYHALGCLSRIAPGRAILALDVSAAHQSLDRPFMRREVHDLCPVLDVPLAVWYPEGEDTVHWWRTASGEVVNITAQRGVDQGCPLASPVFGISTARPAERALRSIQARDPRAVLFQYADDTQFHVAPDHIQGAYEAVSAEWAIAGLSLNRGKTKVWTPSADTQLPADWQPRRVASLKCLGADFVSDGITATPPRHQAEPTEVQAASDSLVRFAGRLVQLQASGLPRQLSQALLRYASVGGPQHILMCRPVSGGEAASYDAALRTAWERVIDIPLAGAHTWERAKLPLKAGGLAVGAISNRASAAYLSSCARTMPEVLRRTGQPSVPALRQVDRTFSNGLQEAVDDLLTRGVDQRLIPFSAVRTVGGKRQKTLVEAVNKGARVLIAAQLTPSENAVLRSASGPGASAFLMLPTQQDHHVEDSLFRAAVARRMGARVCPKDSAGAATCSLISRNGRCTAPLDPVGVHANNCKCAGHVVRRHDRLVRWLASWLAERVESEVLVEQIVGADRTEDRLDITFDAAGRRVWIDVAVVSPLTNCERERVRRSRTDGAAARDEEANKRSRYKGLATPFVLESMGRPGDSARGVLGAYASDAVVGVSADIASAWQSISAIVQSESAALELKANGWTPADYSAAHFHN
jgi:hypothetical protein